MSSRLTKQKHAAPSSGAGAPAAALTCTEESDSLVSNRVAYFNGMSKVNSATLDLSILPAYFLMKSYFRLLIYSISANLVILLLQQWTKNRANWSEY